MPRVKQGASWEAFEQFLLALHSNREIAGEEHERLRSKLLTFFRGRGFGDAEDLADETLDRVIRRNAEVTIDDPTAFALGVAHRVASERFKEDRSVSLSLIADRRSKSEADGAVEQKMLCLERSLAVLGPQDRAIIEEWYARTGKAKGEDKRALMLRFSLSAGALRIRAHRIRKQLREQVENCMASEERQGEDGL